MKWLHKLLLFPLLIIILTSGVYGQTSGPSPVTPNNADNEDRTILMRNEASGGLILHSAGWGLTYRRAKQETYKRKRYYEIDLVTMKDAKEVSSVNPYYDNSSSFIYGKMNDFIIPRIGVGRQQVVFAKAQTIGVEVRWNYGFGASLGITKPIYLDILQPTNNAEVFNVVIQRYNPVLNTPDVIYGTAPFTYGLNEMQIHPGGYIKNAVSFEFAKYPDHIWSLETGAVVDIFTQDIPIMAFIQNKQVFFNFYVSLSYGGKW